MSFLRNYLTYATANEAPEMFHVWGAYICLASAVSRRVWFPADDGFLYPYIYVLYVGKAGNGKGEAMRKAKWIIAKAGNIPLSGNVETPEGFIRYITGNPKANPPVVSEVRKLLAKGPFGSTFEYTPMTIFATEFINYIANNPEGWINVLNDIWDAEPNYHYRTKGQGEDIVPGPAITMLGALTTDMAADLQKQRIIGTGLGRRTIFQYGERQWYKPHPRRIITPEREAARDYCVTFLQKLGKMTGCMYNNSEPQEFEGRTYIDTDEWWDEWYCTNLENTPKQLLNVQSWYASKSDIVIKIAMLTALSDERMRINIADYSVALAYLSLLEEDLPRIFGDMGRNELAAVSQAIFDTVAARTEPISVRRLKSMFWNQCKPPNDYEACISFLCDSGKLKQASLTINHITDVVIATPEVLTNFAAAVASKIPQAAVAPISSPPDAPAEVGPSILPLGTLESEQERRQAIARRIDEIAGGGIQ